MPNRKLSFIALCFSLITGGLTWAQSPPAITEYPIGVSGLGTIVTGPDGALWSGGSPTSSQYVLPASEFVRFALDGTVTTIPVPGNINGMVVGPDGAIWYAGTVLGKVTTAGVVTTFVLPTPGATLGGITVGPDGALWFTESSLNSAGQIVSKIGRATVNATITEYPLPAGETVGASITTGPDGAIWFGEGNGAIAGIQRITTSGVVTDVAMVSNWGPMATGPDGAVWVGQGFAHQIARITVAGAVTEFTLPGRWPGKIVAGPDGALWFTDAVTGIIGQITTTGVFTLYPIPGSTSTLALGGITVGPDAALWFTGWFGSNLGRTGAASNAPLQVETPSTLPSATTNIVYSWPLAASGGTPPYTWSIASGSLPAGLSLAASGTISGTPASAGNYNFSVTVTDSTSATATATLGITVVSPVCNPVVTSTLGSTPVVPAGNVVTFTVSVNAGCDRTAQNLPAWITPVGTPPTSGGTGSGQLSILVAPNYTASSRTAIITVAGVSETIQQQAGIISSAGYMPHLAAEGGWRTTFTLVNKQTLTAPTTLSFADSNGNPLALPLTFPQQPSAAPATQASIVQTIPGNGVSVVEASGPANVPFVEGSASMTSFASVDGFAIFHYDPSGQEAVVPMQNFGPAQQLALPFDNTNGVQTGVALQMIQTLRSGAADIIQVQFVGDNGVIIKTAQQSITLPQGGHTSFVLSTQFPETANARGTAIFEADCSFQPFGGGGTCAQLGVLGIRYTPPGTLTTLPALTAPSFGSGSMAHIASGNGWQTTFVVTNRDGDKSPAVLNFYDDNGNPLSLPLTFLDTGETMTASSVTRTIPGALWIQTSGDVGTPLLTGSAQLAASDSTAFGALAIFRYNPNGQEAVVPLETRNAESYLLAFDNTNNTATGVAISVASSQAVSIPVIIRDGTGAQIGTATVPLAANGHTSFMLATQFPSTAGILGTLEFDTPAGAQLSVLGIRSPPALTFTTLPALAK